MKQLLIFPLSLLPPLTIDALRNISLRPLAQFMTTLGHVPHKFVLLLFVHFTYFHAFRFFSPAIRNDKKRLSWCLTWVSTSVLSIMSLMTVYCSCRTVLHSRIPYEMYNRVDPVSGFAYRRYDAVFPPRSYSGIHSSLGSSSDLHKQDLHSREICLEAFSLVYLAPMATSGNTTKTTSFIANEQCQCTQEQFQRDMYDFYNHVDSTFYAPSSSAKASYPAWSFAAFFGRFSIPLRLFFDASFSPVRDALTEWAVLVLASYLVMDLTLGRRYYRERISFVGGYVHHSMYLYICCVALYTDYTVGMVLFFFDESKSFLYICIDRLRLQRFRFSLQMLNLFCFFFVRSSYSGPGNRVCVPTASTRHAVWSCVLCHTDGPGSIDDARDPAQHDHDSHGQVCDRHQESAECQVLYRLHPAAKAAPSPEK